MQSTSVEKHVAVLWIMMMMMMMMMMVIFFLSCQCHQDV
jgi:hypothetical protein